MAIPMLSAASSSRRTRRMSRVSAAWANVIGVTGAPFDAYLTLRGLRTLFPRIRQQQSSAAVVGALSSMGIPSDCRSLSGPRLASRPCHRQGATVRIRRHAELRVGRRRGSGAPLCRGGRGFHAGRIPGRRRKPRRSPCDDDPCRHGDRSVRAAGISDGLLRLSVGLEAEADLVAGLEAGFAAPG